MIFVAAWPVVRRSCKKIALQAPVMQEQQVPPPQGVSDWQGTHLDYYDTGYPPFILFCK